MGMEALAKFMKKAGNTIKEVGKAPGTHAAGAASLGAKGAAKLVEKNPKKAAALAAAAGFGASEMSDDDDDKKKKKKKKKRPYEIGADD